MRPRDPRVAVEALGLIGASARVAGLRDVPFHDSARLRVVVVVVAVAAAAAAAAAVVVVVGVADLVLRGTAHGAGFPRSDAHGRNSAAGPSTVVSHFRSRGKLPPRPRHLHGHQRQAVQVGDAEELLAYHRHVEFRYEFDVEDAGLLQRRGQGAPLVLLLALVPIAPLFLVHFVGLLAGLGVPSFGEETKARVPHHRDAGNPALGRREDQKRPRAGIRTGPERSFGRSVLHISFVGPVTGIMWSTHKFFAC